MKNFRSLRNAAAMLFAIFAGTVTAFADAPANDNFANAELLAGTRISIVRTNVDATKETYEPDHAQNPGGKSVWFKWTAPNTGLINISTNRTSSNLDTLVAIYAGTHLTNLSSRGAADNVTLTNLRSVLHTRINGGETIYIAIDGSNEGQTIASGEFHLDIHYVQWTQSADVDSDSLTDLTVFRPSTGTWYTLRSSTGAMTAIKWGTTGDIPLVNVSYGNLPDPAVFRPSTGTWYAQSRFVAPEILNWGTAGDIPVPETYYGSEYETTQAVFRPSTGTWYLKAPGAYLDLTYQFGLSGDIPVPGRYSHDQVADIAVYRPSNGVWYILRRQNANPGNDAFASYQFGQPGDKPVPGDYDGDGLLDVAVYRPSTGQWWYLCSSNHQIRAIQFGTASDIPSTGDYDGDGVFDPAVFRPSDGNWYIYQSGNQQVRIQHFGLNGDIPVTSNVR